MAATGQDQENPNFSWSPWAPVRVFTWLTQAARVARGLGCKCGDQAPRAIREEGELGRNADSRGHSELVNASRGAGTFLPF